MQGAKVATVPEAEILDRLLLGAKRCEGEGEGGVEAGGAKLGEKVVEILPPDPLGEVGRDWQTDEESAPGRAELTVGRS